VIPLTRGPATRSHLPSWDPGAGRIDLSKAAPIEAVIHLSGETIAQRWSPAVKERLSRSRVESTRLLCRTLAKLPNRPRTLLCASATGFYGSRDQEILTEQSQPGTGYLAELTRDWEQAAEPALDCGIRTVHLRFGIVLSPQGGALAKMLPAFKLGLAGHIGTGNQYWSWISPEDLAGAVGHLLDHNTLNGPVNVVAPQPITNVEFTRTLAGVLKRPALFPLPAWSVKLLFGQMGLETMLASVRVTPSRLLETGYSFRFPTLKPALQHLLQRG
jgi:uncharacterized protein (TIGR01777 family)